MPIGSPLRLFAAFAAAGFASVASAEDAKAPTPPPTFSKDVAPILFENCVSCHRPNEVAPFTLTSYDDAKRRAKTIAKVTGQRFMPPWKPEPGHGEFVGVRRLTDEQIKILNDWANAGAPEGDPKDPPPCRSSPTAGNSASPTSSSRCPSRSR